MLKKGLKKFYQEAKAEELENGLFRVLLDNRELKTPNKSNLNCAFKLAEAIAEEWNAQGEDIKPSTMPITKFVNTTIDRIAPRRNEVVSELVGYAENDMLFYRVASPKRLTDLQELEWGKILDWFEEKISGKFMVTIGILPVKQNKNVINKIANLCSELNDFALASVYLASANMHSTILAFAFYENKIDANQAFDLSRLEENWQIAEWGEDYEAKDRRDILRAELEALNKFNLLIK